jgi:hypothetical protein
MTAAPPEPFTYYFEAAAIAIPVGHRVEVVIFAHDQHGPIAGNPFITDLDTGIVYGDSALMVSEDRMSQLSIGYHEHFRWVGRVTLCRILQSTVYSGGGHTVPTVRTKIMIAPELRPDAPYR